MTVDCDSSLNYVTKSINIFKLSISNMLRKHQFKHHCLESKYLNKKHFGGFNVKTRFYVFYSPNIIYQRNTKETKRDNNPYPKMKMKLTDWFPSQPVDRTGSQNPIQFRRKFS